MIAKAFSDAGQCSQLISGYLTSFQSPGSLSLSELQSPCLDGSSTSCRGLQFPMAGSCVTSPSLIFPVYKMRLMEVTTYGTLVRIRQQCAQSSWCSTCHRVSTQSATASNIPPVVCEDGLLSFEVSQL